MTPGDVPGRKPDAADATALRRRPGRPRLSEPSPEYVATLDRIVSAAAELFQTHGYAGATLDDVAAALDLRRVSLYHYVRSKAHLLSLVCERALATALVAIDEIEHIKQPTARLEAVVRMHATLIAREPAMAKVFFDEQTSLPDEDRTRIDDIHRRYFAAFTGTVKACIDAGALPQGDARLSALAVVGMVTWVYKWFRPERDNPEAFADTCVALLLAPRRTARRR